MAKIIIQGRKKLKGEVEIFGAKNEATKLVAAACLTDEEVVIDNAPRILDFETMMEIIRSMGGKAEWTGEHQVTINTKKINPQKINQKLVKKLRASVVLMGPILARFKKINFPTPGGCIIGNRPLSTHFDAFEDLGVKIEADKESNSYKLLADKLRANEIILNEFSVTATENILMLASLVPGKTILKIAAAEPHVEDLVKFLNKMGAKIKWIGNHVLEIEGVKKLSGTKHEVIPDTIDAGTFIILGVVTKSNILVKNIEPSHMDAFLKLLQKMGAHLEIGKDFVRVSPSGRLKAVKKIETNIYPGIPTDLQQPLTLLATQAEGTTMVFEKMFEGRFNFVSELKKMGASIEILDPHRLVVNGPVPLTGTEVKSFDLRAGATLLLAGLLAEGETIINEAEVVKRGYENIEERLTKLGAEINNSVSQ